MSQLNRSIGLLGAVAIGLAAMIGAGLFFVWSPAASLAGNWLFLALAIAAGVALLNALSSAQLAMEHPVSGGAYAYGRAEVAPWVGFSAGWMFITGKTFSAAAMALIAARYINQEAAVGWAVIALVALAVVNSIGVRLTTAISSVVVTVVITVVVAALVWWMQGGAATFTPVSDDTSVVAENESLMTALGLTGLPVLGVLQAAGILFFAFAGYARLATLGEEVRDPWRTIPRAIIVSLAIVVALYGAVAIAVTSALGERLPDSVAPLADLVAHPALHTVVIVAAVIACLGSLMGVQAGLSRTSLAMARDGELPGLLGKVHPRTRTPIVAEIACTCLAIIAVVSLPASGTIAFSSTFVLGYYAIAHWSAIRMQRRFAADGAGPRMWLPSWLPWLGLVSCLVIVVTLSWIAVLAAIVWLGIGLFFRRAFAG